jgi:FAD/FMN-containing dehydrogenase
LSTDWPTLQGAIAGEVAVPGSPTYVRTHRGFNARFHDIRPQAIALCTTPGDVAETISFARRHGLHLAARSGGHCFAGNSSTPGIIVDVSPMNAVSLEGTVATIGAGARLGEVYESLQEHGLAIPGGTCPQVGIAGLTLGGGLGVLGRTYGLTCDRLVRARIVLADGRVVECDEEGNKDLFWALRGAGAGNFGVVTSFSFATVPAPEEATNIHLAWPPSHAVAVIRAWQDWGPTGPDELTASLKLTTTEASDRPPSLDVYGVALDGADVTALVDSLVARVGVDPTVATHRRMSFPEIRRFWARLGEAEHTSDQPELAAEPSPYLVSKSEFFRQALPAEAVTALVEMFSKDRVPGQARELDFMPWGGAYNRVAPDATAFVHRTELFQLKHSVTLDPSAPAGEKQAAIQHVALSWASVHPWGSGRVFPNFPDRDLSDWAHAYYGTNYDRLLLIKARYDPGDVFRFSHSLPVR